MLVQWIIEKKRDGQALDAAEIRALIQGYTRGEIPDYQMAAFAMAVYFRGMTPDETAALTGAMMRSGDVLDLSGLSRPRADKHSTGGIGDKVSLLLAPLVACCDVAVPMMAGRGLGITGGTLDKLESIPGYRTALTPPEFMAVIERCGCSIIGQTDRLAPADRKLYALRDVTGTVPSLPLITASILSKKLAAGVGNLTLDVKCGRGAFMKTRAEAAALAHSLVAIGQRSGLNVSALLTDMNQPLGRSAGNAVEVAETVQALQGDGAADLMEVTLELAVVMLLQTGRAPDAGAARNLLQARLDSGAAFRKFQEMVQLQGGNPASLERPDRLPRAARMQPVRAQRAGYVHRVDADLVGRACIVLGAGRTRSTDSVDPAAGVTGIVKIGQAVERGSALLHLHANTSGRLAEAEQLLAGAFEIADDKPAEPVRILDRLGPHTGATP